MVHSKPNISENKEKKRPYSESAILLITGAVLGYFAIMQAYSVDNIQRIANRDHASSIFQEMLIVNQQNRDLKAEIKELEDNLDQQSNRQLRLQALEKEIERYEFIAGLKSVKGPGIKLTIKSGDLDTFWLVDITNELFNSGAEAVSINGLRIVDSNAGFDRIPKGQVLLKGAPIATPYEITAIGGPDELENGISHDGGIIGRLKTTLSEDIEVEITKLKTIEMGKL